ncbi:hypothetical protein pah_c197o113 [Parachlamydia acanthamoebae str. Hall's coccus]|nr:hypothetical protein pah_c197o113 [Parachlamydia acanthamoebae str. Hall's coccus]
MSCKEALTWQRIKYRLYANSFLKANLTFKPGFFEKKVYASFESLQFRDFHNLLQCVSSAKDKNVFEKCVAVSKRRFLRGFSDEPIGHSHS